MIEWEWFQKFHEIKSNEWKNKLTSAIENIQSVERNTNIKLICLITAAVAGYMVILNGFVDGTIIALIICRFVFFVWVLISKSKTEQIRQSEDWILDYLVSERDNFENIKEEVSFYLRQNFQFRGMPNSKLFRCRWHS